MENELLDKLQSMWRQDALPPANLAICLPQVALSEGAISSPNDLQSQLRDLWKPITHQDAALPRPDRQEPPEAEEMLLQEPVFLDIETRSTCDITLGGRIYALHPTTEIVSVVALIDRTVVIWTPNRSIEAAAESLWPPELGPQLPIVIETSDNLPERLRLAAGAGRPFCAHNAHGFDALVWRARGLVEPVRWIDTFPMARAAGLPAGLDQLGQRLFGIGKEQSGHEVVRAISRAGRTGTLPEITAEQLVQIVRYNIQDVVLLLGVYSLVHRCGEPDVMAADQVINNRGVAFDVELARKLIGLEHKATDQLGQHVEAATNGTVKRTDLRRTEFIGEWLRDRGVDLPDLLKRTVERFLESDRSNNTEVRAVLEARLAANRITISKLETAISACGADGRLRDLLVYHGAHTGRWAGRHVQPHNLPRPNPRLTDVSALLPHVDDFRDFARSLPEDISVADGLSALIRPCFRAKRGYVLCIADFAGIEARGVAWCAGEQRQLELFAEGGDNYLDLAGQIFGYDVTAAHKRERAVGKQAVLGCGYGLGQDTFGANCMAMGVDLVAAKTTAEVVVETYRDRYPSIAGRKRPGSKWREGGLWRDLERAARRAINGCGPVDVGKCRLYREHDDLIVRLPSGRLMVYCNARVEYANDRRDETLNNSTPPRKCIVFDSPTIANLTTYGGKLTENIVSAICRDLLAASIVACEQVGLPVVLHVHDEIVVEVPLEESDEALRQLLTIMSTPPAWADGFPIEVEGFSAERYFKTPPNGVRSLRARQGAILNGN